MNEARPRVPTTLCEAGGWDVLPEPMDTCMENWSDCIEPHVLPK
jgi:hypothetical protein